MPGATTRRALPLPVGADFPSEYRLSITAAANAADTDAIYLSGTLTARSSLSGLVAGTFYYVTDATPPALTEYNGTAWGTLLQAGNSPLASTSASGTIIAAPGQLVIANNQVVNLPTPTAVDQLIGVTASSAVTSTTPVTIGVAAGTNVYTVGFNFTAGGSVLLGVAQASMVFQSVSLTHWVCISGQQDTGWVALALATMITAQATYYTPSARRVGDTVRLSGAVNNGTGGSSIIPVATVPSNCFPAENVVVMGVDPTGVAPVVLSINTSGAMVATVWGNGRPCVLDGLSYRPS